jgi:hypothetical protein
MLKLQRYCFQFLEPNNTFLNLMVNIKFLDGEAFSGSTTEPVMLILTENKIQNRTETLFQKRRLFRLKLLNIFYISPDFFGEKLGSKFLDVRQDPFKDTLDTWFIQNNNSLKYSICSHRIYPNNEYFFIVFVALVLEQIV